MSLLRSLFSPHKAHGIPVALSLTMLALASLPSAFAVRIEIPDDGAESRPINQPLPATPPPVRPSATPSAYPASQYTGVYPTPTRSPQMPSGGNQSNSAPYSGMSSYHAQPMGTQFTDSQSTPSQSGSTGSHSANMAETSAGQTSEAGQSPYRLPSSAPKNTLPPRADGYDTLPSLPPTSERQADASTKRSSSALRQMKPSTRRAPRMWGQPTSPTTALPPFPGGDTPEASPNNPRAGTSLPSDATKGKPKSIPSMGAMGGGDGDPPVIVPKDGTPVTLSMPPSLNPQLIPVDNQSGASSPFSLDNPANTQDYMRYEPYNIFPREIDLWNLEGKRFVRSLVVVSPDKSQFAYSEVLFLPYNRQTVSRLYLVNTPPLPVQPMAHLPSEDALRPIPPIDYSAYAARYNPAKTVQLRKTLLEVGYTRVKPFDFKTLTVVDWSNTGKRLLLKEKSGILHVGLRTSDILVYDQPHGTVTIYPEIRRVIQHYWKTKGNMPDLPEMSWEVYPMGWELGSDSAILLKAWALDTKEKKFLGVWRYDVEAERTELLSLEDSPVMVAANGLLATPIPPPPVKKSLWKRTIQQITPGDDDFDTGPASDLDVYSDHRIDRDE